MKKGNDLKLCYNLEAYLGSETFTLFSADNLMYGMSLGEEGDCIDYYLEGEYDTFEIHVFRDYYIMDGEKFKDIESLDKYIKNKEKEAEEE